MVRFHLFIFMDRYKNIFSKNSLAEILSQISSYGKSTLKKDFANKNFSKVSERIKEKDKKFGDVFEKMIQMIFKNKDNYFGLGEGEVFELLPESLKEFKDMWIAQKEILNNYINDIGKKELDYIGAVIDENKGNIIMIDKNGNEDIIVDDIKKFDENEKIEILYSFHYQFCLYANHIFNFDYENFIISFFEKNDCKKDLLNAIFSNSYFNLGRDEKRNVKNIINQKTIMKLSTLKKYFIEEDKLLIYYGLYLYLDYLKFLIKEFNINNEIFCKFVEKIKRRD